MRRFFLESIAATSIIAVVFAGMVFAKMQTPGFHWKADIAPLIWIPAILAILGGPLVAGRLAWQRSRRKKSN
jgi:hypothetical protein